MAGLDDLFAQIPVQDIANKLGADEGEVNSAIQTLIPVLVGGLQENAQDPDHASEIESAASSHAARGLLDSGVAVDQVDQNDGQKAIAKIFGGNDTGQVAAALAGGGAGNSDLLKQLLPILAPIVLAYIGKQMGQKSAPEPAQQSSGGVLGDVLGSILGGAAGGSKSSGSILGNILGGKAGGAIGDILGGLLGGKK
ncbi:DUF937 domain-containing protein [Mycobacterium talmoniae]|uniref:DUF937 domain-containing protein n=1 Tax=Mycobacterium talmoniae TaxID=1858794 RepID=A0A1S1NET8_9MYCO|nr:MULTISPECIES: DUF937 domain-containing protein [Mycobacterium]OHU99150.1 hypothetical protein BKN37_19525 [Mycobacterium talmoniae]PQM47752.1 hypothetical protein C1Y40_02039 [Mycobacterium talmoniae]TDH50679.1 DUF937 domain-containing protein [Mycobacterium eburneum]